MKNIFRIFLVALFGILLISCEKDEDKAVLGVTTKGSVASSTSTVVLNQTTLNATAATFTWVDPVFSANVAETKQLEFGKTGTNFNPSSTMNLPVTGNSIVVTHEQLNTILSQLGLTPGQASQVQVRLKSTVGTSVFYSDPITITATPFVPNPDLMYPKINVPGSYATAAGYADWTPGNTMNLYSPASDNKYRGFIYVTNPNSEYKLTVNQDWAGDKGEVSAAGNTGVLVQDGENNIKAALAGTYYIKVDWTGNTYSENIANFGIIGDATPTQWNSDTDFVYNPATKNWEIASIALNNTGVFKFRANDDWAMKFQPASADQTLASGVGVQTFLSSEGTVNGDPSYKVAQAGNYKVVLDLHNSAFYKLTVTKL